MKARCQVAPLKAALRPFAAVKLYSDPEPRRTYPGYSASGDHVALYAGPKDMATDPEDMPLTVADFQRAREALAP